MKGLDTNVLLRFFVRDDAKQARAAAEFLSKTCTPTDPGFVNLIVLCELVWTLSRTYGYTRSEIADVVDAMLGNAALVMEAQEAVVGASQRYRETGIDLSDLLIDDVNRAQGCLATVTFDRKAAKLDGFQLLT